MNGEFIIDGSTEFSATEMFVEVTEINLNFFASLIKKFVLKCIRLKYS